MKEDVTVTVVHPRTEDLESMIHEAYIFIAAIGQPMMVTITRLIQFTFILNSLLIMILFIWIIVWLVYTLVC